MNGKGDCKFRWYGPAVIAVMNQLIKKRLETIGHVLVAKVREKISKKGTGRVYKRGNIIHIASAPGMPPVIWSGDLHQYIFFRIDGDPAVWYLRVGTDRKYGPALEFGTDDMKARPWLGVTLKENTELIKTMLEAKWF